MRKVLASELKVGDTIMPPEREVRLWMRRDCTERNLPETALHLTIAAIEEGAPDKRGRWLLISTDQTPEWLNGRPQRSPFRFKARPDTPWPKL